MRHRLLTDMCGGAVGVDVARPVVRQARVSAHPKVSAVRQFLLVTLVLCSSSLARAQAAGIDTRITFTMADDDIMKGPEESTSGSPTLPNFTPTSSSRLFYDDYERRDNGLENLSHLVLYGHKPGFFAGVDTEAALVLRAELLQKQDVALRDDGSYIRLSKAFGETKKLSLVAFPVSAHRFALGYSYDLSWGGAGIFKSTASPGFKVQYDASGMYLFAGAKTGLTQTRMPDNSIENDTVWGVLGGAGVDIMDSVRVEGGSGYFYRGKIDKSELQTPDTNGRTKSAPWEGFGGSAQVVYHQGVPIGVPIDFRLYRNDPLKREDFFNLEDYPGGISFIAQSEVNWLGQTLQDFDRPNSTVVQQGRAADLTFKLKVDKARFFALGVYRELAYLLFNVPSYPPFVSFPKGIEAKPEAFAYFGFDYFIEEWHLTPGASVGVQKPAYQTARVSAGNNAPQSLGAQTHVFRSESELPEVLNPGDKVSMILAGKVTFRWELSEMLGAVGEFQAAYDRNRRILAQDANGVAIRLATDPKIFGFAFMMQARL